MLRLAREKILQHGAPLGSKVEVPPLQRLVHILKSLRQSILPQKQTAHSTQLEGSSWYQAKDSVEEYINRFQDLIEVAEYVNDKTIVIKFPKGLNPTMQNKVALIGDNALDFDDTEGWYEAARKVARNKEYLLCFNETDGQ
jgi:hypothetical protein